MNGHCGAKRTIAITGQRRLSIGVQPTVVAVVYERGIERNVAPNVGGTNGLLGVVVNHQITPITRVAKYCP